MADFDRVLKLDPGDAKAYDAHGIAYGEKGELDRAIADFDRAAAAYLNRGWTCASI